MSTRPPGKTYALLIGIDHPESPGLRPLEFAVADVHGFRDLLLTRLGVDTLDCQLLASPALEGEPLPRKNEILRRLTHFGKARMTAADTFIFYFAGHGFARRDGNDSDTFLMAADSSHESRALLEESAISLAQLKRFLGDIGAGQQLVILDACRNDPQTGTRSASDAECDAIVTRDIVALAKPSPPTLGTSPVRRSVLSACWTGEKSHEYREGGHSWFCHHLLAALREHPGPVLPVNRAWVDHMGDRMKASAWRDLPEAGLQHPHLVPEDGDNIVLALLPPQPPVVGRPKPPVVPGPTPATRHGGWLSAALFYLALLIPLQSASLVALRFAVKFARDRAWFDLPPTVAEILTLVVSLGIAWWASGRAAVLFGMARHDGSSVAGQVIRYFARSRMKS